MADVKVSALTALTGADLANGDQFLVTDVGSPNVSKSITADELAQGAQFSSRFVGKAADEYRWLGATQFNNIGFGSPTLGQTGPNTYVITPVWLLDASTAEGVATTANLPSHWATYHIDIWWTNAASSSGDVRWRGRWTTFGDNEQSDSSTANNDVTASAPTTNGITEITRMNSAAVTNVVGEVIGIRISRTATDAADTLANDAALIGVMLVRAS